MPDYAVAAGHELTAAAAADVCAAGGSAVDAAIAGALVACVAEPVLAGLCGGVFLMVRGPEGQTALLDGFVQTPRRKRPPAELDFREIHADFGSVRQAFHIGTGAIATPGFAAGLGEAHARHGRVPMAELAEPAVKAARDGVEVSAFQARLARIVAPILTASDGARALFCDGDELLAAASLYRNPALADVIEVMALEGARFVTEGEVAAGLLALTSEGGHLERADLARYRPVWRTPLTRRRGHARIALNPPPALGGMLIAFALELIERGAPPVSLARAFAATCRARVEAALQDDPVAGAQALLSDDLIARYRREVAGRPAAVRGTTQISVIDGHGMGAALTLSNGEGCGLVIPGTGIMPNNMLGEEDLVPGGWQSWTPDVRLSSMMAPLAVDWPDGRVAMIGSGGSNRIRTALTQVLLGLVDRDLPLGAAIEAPRLHVECDAETTVDFEQPGLAEGDRVALLDAFPEARGWNELSMFFGGAHAVMRQANGALVAAGDPRRAGAARSG
ncbi:MAG TPA: gamma-glutamyltransferase [Thermohalobaculum sp.]|nr:gamma-glutamyltransferase [Thermohalobaculum sp.]